MGIPFAQGVQMLYDGQLQYVRGGLECWLRVSNFAPSGDWIEVGVSFSPTGVAAAQTGFVDILIDPPPATVPVGMHNIGMSGGKLMFGARKFFISNTWVDKIAGLYPNIRGRFNVFRDWDGTASTLGIIYNNQLYSIEDIGRREIAGQTINWILTCNAEEEYLEPAASESVAP